MIGYWAIMTLIPVPGFGPGVLTPEGNLTAYLDRLFLPGKLHRQVYDPEGLLSNIPAIGSALSGVFAGRFLRWESDNWSKAKKAVTLAIAAVIMLAIGKLWGLCFPINKNMWTSSFVLFAGGWSVLLLSIFYFVIDVAGIKKWSMPYVWIGTNSILIYMAAHGIVDFEHSSQFLFGGLFNLAPAIWHDALLWIRVTLIQLGLLYFLYKKKWFLKI